MHYTLAILLSLFHRQAVTRGFLCVLATLTCQSVGAAEVQITQLADIDFGRVPPTVSEVRSAANFCVALEPQGRFNIIATGDGPGGSFLLQQSGGVGAISYTVTVSDRGRGRGRLVQAGVPLGGLRALSPRPNGACSQPFGTVTAMIDGRALRAARPGFYRGTLNLLVAPE